jgi:hypothetical protein
MTADDIEALLLRSRWGAHTTVPNYTPARWWECDVIEFTAAGYFREYEIKVSRSDFFHDADKKAALRFPSMYGKEPAPGGESKHELLAKGDPRGPVQFWFVVPAGLVRLNEVPTWAGLIEIDESPAPYSRLSERESKKAPRLHSTKAGEAVRLHAVSVCYYRFHGSLSKLTRLQRETRKQVALLRKMGWPKVRPKT